MLTANLSLGIRFVRKNYGKKGSVNAHFTEVTVLLAAYHESGTKWWSHGEGGVVRADGGEQVYVL